MYFRSLRKSLCSVFGESADAPISCFRTSGRDCVVWMITLPSNSVTYDLLFVATSLKT